MVAATACVRDELAGVVVQTAEAAFTDEAAAVMAVDCVRTDTSEVECVVAAAPAAALAAAESLGFFVGDASGEGRSDVTALPCCVEAER